MRSTAYATRAAAARLPRARRGAGTAGDFRDAAQWLRRNYPDGVAGESYATGADLVILNMTNHGALAILALTMKRRRKVPSPDEADLRWLITLETFPADASGWRQVGAQLLAEESGLAYSTSRQARDRLVAAGVVEYQPGNGRGKRSSYRFATPLKVPTLERHLAETGEDDPAKGADPDSAPYVAKGADLDPAPFEPQKGAGTTPVKVPRRPKKGAEHNPLTSGNANPALDTSALDTSALSRRERACEAATTAEPTARREEREADVIEGKITRASAGATPLAERIAAAVPGASLEDAEALIAIARRNPKVRHPAAWLQAAIDNGTIADLMADEAASAQLAAELFGPRPASPPSQAADVRETGVPETRTSVRPADFAEPQAPPWKTVTCPVCKAGPGAFCRNPASGGTASTHRERHLAAANQ